MKSLYPRIGMTKLCGWFGITRQAYYQNTWRISQENNENEFLLKRIKEIREKQSRMGTRKLYSKLQEFMKEHQIKMGRDALFNLLAENKMLVRRRKRGVRTTNSSHWLKKYPNLINEFTPTAPNKLWVSDITYWKLTNGRFVYISLITDAFSRKIVGFHVADSLAAIESIKALDMALDEWDNKGEGLIHHSDRGVQYCSSGYVKKLNKNKVNISMTENGSPYENALAERVNGILKDEYLYDYKVSNLIQARKRVREVINLYNDERPHSSIGNLTPSLVHEKNIKTKKLWKNYYKKHEN